MQFLCDQKLWISHLSLLIMSTVQATGCCTKGMVLLLLGPGIYIQKRESCWQTNRRAGNASGKSNLYEIYILGLVC